MDYGHTDKSNDNFFTAEAGDPSGNFRKPELDDNLSLSNESVKWSKITPERNPRDLGNRIVNSPDIAQENMNSTSSPELELGKIVEFGMPPGSSKEDTKTTSEIIKASFDKTVIKTDKKLDDKAIKEIDMAIAKLSQTGDVADFYDTARDAMEANLGNSYNRKLAA